MSKNRMWKYPSKKTSSKTNQIALKNRIPSAYDFLRTSPSELKQFGVKDDENNFSANLKTVNTKCNFCNLENATKCSKIHERSEYAALYKGEIAVKQSNHWGSSSAMTCASATCRLNYSGAQRYYTLHMWAMALLSNAMPGDFLIVSMESTHHNVAYK